MITEIDVDWKDIPNWSNYKCNKDGMIKRKKGYMARKERIVNPSRLNSGYLKVALCKKVRKEFTVHSLVMLTFIGNRPKGMDICHGNGNKEDNRLENLRYDSRKNNQLENVKLGKSNRGERCGNYKWNRKIVIDIIKRSRNGEVVRQLAKEYKMPPPTAYSIVKRRNWYWLTEEEIWHSQESTAHR